MTRLWLTLALCTQAAHADTIDFKDETSINGVVTYKSGVFEVAGRWKGKQLVVGNISAKLVKAVRFNSLESNPSATPPEILPLRGNGRVTCEVVLADGSKLKTGVLESIDEASVRIGQTGIERKRIALLRLVEK